MLKTAIYFAETTDMDLPGNLIDDALRSLRITAALLLRETYAPPWSIAVPDAGRLAELLAARPGSRVVAFHLVELGHCWLRPRAGEAMLLKAGEMAVVFGGGAHLLGQGEPPSAQPVEDLLAGGPNLQRPDTARDRAGAALLCGVFVLQHTALNPLFAALPAVLHGGVSRSGELHNLSGVARLIAEELDRERPGGGFVVERLLEALCAEAVRATIERDPGRGANWLRGIRDPVVARAIAALHRSPGEDWTVRRLSEAVAMSPSRFAARFSGALGDSPMAYLAKWRMNVACRVLEDSSSGVEQIADSLGYDSAAAFSRAFKKLLGVSPAAWRARFRSAAVTD